VLDYLAQAPLTTRTASGATCFRGAQSHRGHRGATSLKRPGDVDLNCPGWCIARTDLRTRIGGEEMLSRRSQRPVLLLFAFLGVIAAAPSTASAQGRSTSSSFRAHR
jgi:hypothetical protein